jgi:acetyl esterase
MFRAIALTLLIATSAAAQVPDEMSVTKPVPKFRNDSYGPHQRHVFDLWQAKSDKPTSLLIFFHGGGFVGGDKWTLHRPMLDAALETGISVASANYRKSSHAIAPASMLDGARLVQFVRLNAKRYNIDPNRIALCGNSAGAGITLWVAFHNDLADPQNEDPVLRQSSRVQAAAVIGGQCSYDPRFIREVVGGRAWEHPALPMLHGIKPEEMDTPEAHKKFEEAAAITYLTKDDPPVIGWYGESAEPLKPGPNLGPNLYYPDFGKQLPGQDNPGKGIHHPKFGFHLQEKMRALGIDCEIKLRENYPNVEQRDANAEKDIVDFLKKHL